MMVEILKAADIGKPKRERHIEKNPRETPVPQTVPNREKEPVPA